jgi:hypothetical protein
LPACTMRSTELTIIESASLGSDRWLSSAAITRSGAVPLGERPERAAGDGRRETNEGSGETATAEGVRTG